MKGEAEIREKGLLSAGRPYLKSHSELFQSSSDLGSKRRGSYFGHNDTVARDAKRKTLRLTTTTTTATHHHHHHCYSPPPPLLLLTTTTTTATVTTTTTTAAAACAAAAAAAATTTTTTTTTTTITTTTTTTSASITAILLLPLLLKLLSVFVSRNETRRVEQTSPTETSGSLNMRYLFKSGDCTQYYTARS